MIMEKKMPEISRFEGIIIRMFFRGEHNPPHFHAFHGDNVAVFSIKSGQMIEGDFPTKKAALVTAWTILHQDDLIKNWNNLAKGEKALKIKPLR